MSEAEEGIVLRVIEALTDDRVLSLLKKVLYPHPLDDKLEQISKKNARIRQLEMKVNTLEEEMDKHEQYTRRSNIVFRGFAETGQGENMDAKILSLVNNEMKITPALTLTDIARSHRLGKPCSGFRVSRSSELERIQSATPR